MTAVVYEFDENFLDGSKLSFVWTLERVQFIYSN